MTLADQFKAQTAVDVDVPPLISFTAGVYKADKTNVCKYLRVCLCWPAFKRRHELCNIINCVNAAYVIELV